MVYRETSQPFPPAPLCNVIGMSGSGRSGLTTDRGRGDGAGLDGRVEDCWWVIDR